MRTITSISTILKVVLAVSFIGCGYKRVGVTKCGVTLMGETGMPGRMPPEISWMTAWDFDEFQDAETAAVEALSHVDDDRFRNVCASLRGVQVYVNPQQIWKNQAGIYIAGQTFCGVNELGIITMVEIGNSSIRQTSLAHEFAHVVQKCQTKPPLVTTDGEDYDHSGWHRDGIYAAIEQFHAIKD